MKDCKNCLRNGNFFQDITLSNVVIFLAALFSCFHLFLFFSILVFKHYLHALFFLLTTPTILSFHHGVSLSPIFVDVLPQVSSDVLTRACLNLLQSISTFFLSSLGSCLKLHHSHLFGFSIF